MLSRDLFVWCQSDFGGWTPRNRVIGEGHLHRMANNPKMTSPDTRDAPCHVILIRPISQIELSPV
jgi:hypothetical protein